MNKETIEKMGKMRLYGMQAAFRECTEGIPHAALTTDETAGLIVKEILNMTPLANLFYVGSYIFGGC